MEDWLQVAKPLASGWQPPPLLSVRHDGTVWQYLGPGLDTAWHELAVGQRLDVTGWARIQGAQSYMTGAVHAPRHLACQLSYLVMVLADATQDAQSERYTRAVTRVK